MTVERWQQVKELFAQALERATGERAAFLDEACAGDEALRREVELLLSGHERAGSFIQKPALEVAAEALAQGQDPPLLGRRFGAYQILSRLGAGGMGEVYLAEDTRLKRKVALKLLPAQFTADPERVRRFEQEARAASALNHPNIITIHEIGQCDGAHYIVTEYIAGETLREHMKRERLGVTAALEVALQVASALEAAHEAGITHRDIKPENVMLRRDGYVKVLDFGLAKLAAPSAEMVATDAPTAPQTSTESGVVLGTVAYMSPEQARGQKVDARSDIFSLGVMLYEMIAGRRPFEGVTTSDLIAALLTSTPPPLSQHQSAVPAELEQVVSRCLEKDREQRYQSAHDLIVELRGCRRESQSAQATANAQKTAPLRAQLAWHLWLAAAALVLLLIAGLGYVFYGRRAPAAPEAEIKSLAVLPFRSLNPEAKDDFLGFGMANEVITKVSQVGGLVVRPISAVRKYVTQEVEAIEAARQLQVDAVVDATYQRAEGRLRVSVNLLRVVDGESLWAESFDLREADIFGMQDEVARQVVSKLRLRLDAPGQARLAKRHTTNLVAYDYYTKAMYHFSDRGLVAQRRERSDTAIELFKKAIELDPNYALAHAQLGYAYAWTAVFIEENPALIERAKQEIGVVEKLDPQLAEVHVVRSFILYSWYENWQIEGAIRELRLAQQLNPQVGHHELGSLYHHLGFDEEAVKEMKLALEKDPTSEAIKASYVHEYFETARTEEGLAANKQIYGRGPDVRYYLGKGMVKEATPLVEQEYQKNPDNAQARRRRALLLALQGKHHEAQAAVPAILEKVQRNRSYHHYTYDIARIYALGGKGDEALKWLRVTVKEGFPNYSLFLRDSFLDPIRRDPEFIKFLAEMKERWAGYRREFG